MNRLALLLLLLACGAPPIDAPCPTPPSDYAPCLASEVAEQRCSYGRVYVCEPSISTCYPDDLTDDGQCAVHRVELEGAHWMFNGWCHQ